uniref:Ig-like domain-containing protein n=1 Tax=Hucho hucho TaxID=62062 RepID=A0A4W5JMM1_9TELE
MYCNSTFYKYNVYHESKDNPHFSVQSGKGINHLRISDDMQLSDSATYYCANTYNNMVHFEDGVNLIVKGTERVLISESLKSRSLWTLICTNHTETCAEEHIVYWFRHGSGESHPGIIYTHGDRSDQCEKCPAGSPTQSCIYNLPKRNLSLSDAGIYYCAVASCGEMLFLNGTKLEIKGSIGSLSLILFLHLTCIIYNTNKRTCLQYGDSLHYVSLNLSKKKNRSRRQRSNMEEETVYSGIRQ